MPKDSNQISKEPCSKLIISLDGSPDNEIDGGGTFSQTSWQTLLPYINTLFAIKQNEQIQGFIVNEHGIKAKIKTNKI